MGINLGKCNQNAFLIQPLQRKPGEDQHNFSDIPEPIIVIWTFDRLAQAHIPTLKYCTFLFFQPLSSSFYMTYSNVNSEEIKLYI